MELHLGGELLLNINQALSFFPSGSRDNDDDDEDYDKSDYKSDKKEEEPETTTVFPVSEDIHIRKSWTKNVQYNKIKQKYKNYFTDIQFLLQKYKNNFTEIQDKFTQTQKQVHTVNFTEIQKKTIFQIFRNNLTKVNKIQKYKEG